MKLEEFDQRAAKLSPVGTEMESELELSMYRITEWELVYYDGEFKTFLIIIDLQLIVFSFRIRTRSRFDTYLGNEYLIVIFY